LGIIIYDSNVRELTITEVRKMALTFKNKRFLTALTDLGNGKKEEQGERMERKKNEQ
jgi:hypothetical protein